MVQDFKIWFGFFFWIKLVWLYYKFDRLSYFEQAYSSFLISYTNFCGHYYILFYICILIDTFFIEYFFNILKVSIYLKIIKGRIKLFHLLYLNQNLYFSWLMLKNRFRWELSHGGRLNIFPTIEHVIFYGIKLIWGREFYWIRVYSNWKLCWTL